ncbi:hypothetical protein B0H19DRAFT_1167305 [Mycena capillaripes]|nr:hypothetical protein B0H19DRAFT_1167305 [Mycena capillaripes]
MCCIWVICQGPMTFCPSNPQFAWDCSNAHAPLTVMAISATLISVCPSSLLLKPRVFIQS